MKIQDAKELLPIGITRSVKLKHRCEQCGQVTVKKLRLAQRLVTH